jgi:hypothetical protein
MGMIGVSLPVRDAGFDSPELPVIHIVFLADFSVSFLSLHTPKVFLMRLMASEMTKYTKPASFQPRLQSPC